MTPTETELRNKITDLEDRIARAQNAIVRNEPLDRISDILEGQRTHYPELDTGSTTQTGR